LAAARGRLERKNTVASLGFRLEVHQTLPYDVAGDDTPLNPSIVGLETRATGLALM